MGQSSNGMITDDFWQQVTTGSDQGIAQKSENRMILTDQYGQVILNNELALAVGKAKDSYSKSSIATQSCQAIWTLLEQNQSNTAVASLFQQLRAIGKEDAIKYMELMLKNGGYQSGGVVYVNKTAGGPPYYNSASVAKNAANCSEDDIVSLQAGYVYAVYDESGAIYNSLSGYFYDGSSFTNLSKQNAQYLGNVISYFGPMISAAIQNNSSGTEDIQASKQVTSGYTLYYDEECHNPLPANPTEEQLSQAKGWKNGTRQGVIGDGESVFTYSLSDGENKGYTNALNGDKLQAGFKSGSYQLCMVDDAYKGIYHKNTTLEYFVHMNYVVEKTDSSEREEITAWFNAEQAEISEQETYWDTEITNLSTELNSVNTEIDSVKTLKSNAIKSVFDWGSS